MDSKRMPIRRLAPGEYPELLRQIHDPPERLSIRGALPPRGHKLLTVVGARRASGYGTETCEELIAGLKGLPVAIVSGLALGIDSIAHRAALRNGLLTIAVPGSGLSEKVMYPASHAGLAEEIVRAGGALLSPFEDDQGATIWSFPLRNRIMAGMSHATLVIECETKSGTLITAKHSIEFNRDVLVVPGSIFAAQSAGPHMLLRLGATPVTSAKELRAALGFSEAPEGAGAIDREKEDMSPEEIAIIGMLRSPLSREALYGQAREAGIDTARASVLVSILEIKGLIKESMGEFRALRPFDNV